MTEITIATPAGAVSGSVHGAGATCLALGHGAGGSRRTPFLVRFAEAIARQGRMALLFNFPYSEERRRLPDRAVILEATVAAVAERARARATRVVLGGKSMGGRVASQAAAHGVGCDGLVFLGYPLHPPGQPERLRDAHLVDVPAPMLFLQGERDAFARPDLIEAVAARLGARARLVGIPKADHSFAVPRRSGLEASDVEVRLIEETGRWLDEKGL